MAPATPPPKIKSLFAALTMASVAISVRSPCSMTILSENDFIAGKKTTFAPPLAFLFRCLLLGVFIDSAARFPPQTTFFYKLAQQAVRAVFFSERAVEVFQNIQSDIQSDKIH